MVLTTVRAANGDGMDLEGCAAALGRISRSCNGSPPQADSEDVETCHFKGTLANGVAFSRSVGEVGRRNARTAPSGSEAPSAEAGDTLANLTREY